MSGRIERRGENDHVVGLRITNSAAISAMTVSARRNLGKPKTVSSAR